MIDLCRRCGSHRLRHLFARFYGCRDCGHMWWDPRWGMEPEA